MSFVNTYALKFEKDVGDFTVFVSNTEFRENVYIAVVCDRRKEDEWNSIGRYSANILDLQTTPAEKVAVTAVKHSLKEMSRQMHPNKRALDSRETFKNLTNATTDLINQFLEEHEKQVEKDRREQRKERIYGKV